ncbi:Trk potassium uptake system protein TrkH [hydrothermal vent metagenome]|uniref:Trk potassium uptake system protein TrkH n=1 Tax=hydrothermal vent metagenome TaxID=652676 RepID=A0A3B1BB23_9ZZZZ
MISLVLGSSRVGRRSKTVIQITGFLCMAFSLTMLAPLLVSFWYDDGEAGRLLIDFVVMLSIGFLLWVPFRKRHYQLRRRDGFFIVVIFWILLSLLGLAPFYFGLDLSFIDALFESVSGLTTTGATVISDLDQRPRSILFYRQELQWFGGMGLIVLAVAVMPMLGIGGMSVYRAEAPGPMKEEKMTPRLASTARSLWVLYLGLTLTCALAYWYAGMSPFDAISHSLATVSTGGFSTHDASLAWFNSVAIEMVAVVFMLLGGINFSVHFLALRHISLRDYIRDTEVRIFLLLILGMIVLTSLSLRLSGHMPDSLMAIREASFEVVSVITSTGFGLDDFSVWPIFLPALLMFSSFVGGCGGSTAGGMKVMRVILLAKLGFRELKLLIHTRGIFPIKVGGRRVRENTLQAVWGFFAVYVLIFVLLMLLMMMCGLDQLSAFSAIATCMNNLGPGLGDVSQTFANISSAGKLVAVVAMLIGRLEIFTVLVLLHPAFWRS